MCVVPAPPRLRFRFSDSERREWQSGWLVFELEQPFEQSANRSSLTSKYRPICCITFFSVSDLESARLAGIYAFIWSNLCTRHIPEKLTPRGHEDWPDKRRSVYRPPVGLSATRTKLRSISPPR